MTTRRHYAASVSSARSAQVWHAVTAAVAVAAVVAQLVMVVRADSVPADAPPQGLGERVLHYVSYFTVLSNLLVAWTSLRAARDPRTDGPVWRVLRLDAVVAITVTGLVHWFLLRPLVTVVGWGHLIDTLLHVVVPVLAVTGWLLFGPRPRVTGRVVLLALIFPFAWLAYTFAMGALTGWYPYPFLDLDEQGGGPVIIACLGVAGLLFALAALGWLADRRLPHGPARLQPADVRGD